MTSRDAVDDLRVAAVVVTYNRKELLMECLEALLRQTRPLQAIYIIDNASTDGTPELLHREGYTPSLEGGTLIRKTLHNQEEIRIIHIRLPENTGGAGGFHEGVKRAYHDGYDWIWLMDDDAEPLKDSLEKLLPYDSEGVVALANLKVSPDGTPQFRHRGFFDFEGFGDMVRPLSPDDLRGDCVEIDHASFVGLLVNLKAVEYVGFPRADFFLHFDDVEYCLRLRRRGSILLIPGSPIVHKDGAMVNTGSRRIIGRDVPVVPYDRLWLRYYGVRNSVWLRKMNMKRWKFYLFLLRAIPLSIGGQLISGENRLRRLKFILNAYMDGFKGSFDNEKPRMILYS
ncbi:glycosyltransferase family 2 protein [Methanothermobacter sp. K4]|uniref:glycosyltransferase family 2 protein n=1 Tax=Methanothermobacter sp. K4 TaxID=2913262 RepID=UPI001EDA3601|nr:glycosyltransferase family 2 protein [Methanothermobacter sp. K4]MCG2828369.1 glycosyltransferase family 2 protein [Methanothermobacter sp. K4]